VNAFRGITVIPTLSPLEARLTNKHDDDNDEECVEADGHTLEDSLDDVIEGVEADMLPGESIEEYSNCTFKEMLVKAHRQSWNGKL